MVVRWVQVNQSAGLTLASQERKNMKSVKSLVLAAVALAFCSSSVLAACCDATVEAGKKCDHKCCVKAANDGKVCEKCHPKKDKEKDK